MNDGVDQAVRQSGAIFLKNHCAHFWPEREVTAAGDSGPAFVIHENDKKVRKSFSSKSNYFKTEISKHVRQYMFSISEKISSSLLLRQTNF